VAFHTGFVSLVNRNGKATTMPPGQMEKNKTTTTDGKGPSKKNKTAYTTATTALGERSTSRKKDPEPRHAAPKRKQPELPIVNIKPMITERGDDTSRTESGIRAKCTQPDIHVNVDPSFPTNQIPENDPKFGRMDHPAAAAIQSDGSMEPGPARSTLTDEISAVTDVTKTGATLPASQFDKKVNIPSNLLSLSLLQREGGDTRSDFGSAPGEGPRTNVEGKNTANSLDPTQSPTAPQQGQRNAQGDTMRPLYGMANPLDVVPSTRNQIKSGLLFSDFHIVAPGNGLGATNKMFLMEEIRQAKIRYHGPMALPRSDGGPTNTVLQPPLEWQNSITDGDVMRESFTKIFKKAIASAVKTQVGTGSMNILGDDYGLLRDTSAKGLPRPEDSPFEPIILKPTPMERVRPLTGLQLKNRHLRRLFDSERWPEHFSPHIGQEGGSHYSRRSSLRLLPFPLGVA
jgi:hypothetical protein